MRQPDTVSRQLTSTDDWGAEFRIYRGGSIRVVVAGNPVYLQLAIEQPPDTPEWHSDPIILAIGTHGHTQPFGAFRFKSLTPGSPALLTVSAYGDG